MASRILSMSPVGSKFLGPVVIEVPHVASLRQGVRETAILRCDSAAKGKWEEHKQEALEESLKASDKCLESVPFLKRDIFFYRTGSSLTTSPPLLL